MEEAEEKRAKEEAEKEAKMLKGMEESAKHRNKQVSPLATITFLIRESFDTECISHQVTVDFLFYTSNSMIHLFSTKLRDHKIANVKF